MGPSTVEPPFDQFLATAEEVVRDRPEADLEIVRETRRLHDPEGASTAYLIAARILQL